MCLCIINQAKWKQTPVMLLISFSGYLVNFFTARRFPGNSQISQTLGAFTIGVLGNLYSRLRHGVAAAALLPVSCSPSLELISEQRLTYNRRFSYKFRPVWRRVDHSSPALHQQTILYAHVTERQLLHQRARVPRRRRRPRL